MKRSPLAVLLPLLAFLAAAPALAEAQSRDADAPPNIVLIISDDQAWTDFGFMGHDHIETPNIDRLADQSLTYTRGYVPHGLCRPSLASMITGLYPHQHGIVGNDPPKPEGMNRRQARQSDIYRRRRSRLITRIDLVPTLPRMLRQSDYLSHQSGKWWEGSYKRGGFTHGMTEGFPNPGGRHGDKGLSIGRQGLDPIFNFIDEARQRDRPFFLWYAPFLPHRPHNPPQRLLEKYQQRTDSIHLARYWAMCEWFDQTVGDLLTHLDDRGLAENTIVLFVVDNGWVQERDRSGYAERSKRTVYENGIRTPIMIRWPGRVEPRFDREHPVSSLDLAPTILRAAGLEPTDRMPGVNLLDREAVAGREAIFGAGYHHDIADLDDPTASLKRRWCIAGRWKLLLPHEPVLPDAPVALYDLNDDPHERHNLADQRPEVRQRLRRRIERWWSPN